MSDIRTFKVSADDDGIRLDRWFKRHLPETTFNTVSRWARTGQLRIDGKRAAPGDRIEAGQNIRVPPAETTASPLAVQKKKRPVLSEDEKSFIQSLVIHSDKSAFVINKPPGLATQGGTKTTDHVDRLLDGLVEDDASRPKLVHRLDKDTSGALLIARTPRAAAYFSKSFSGRTARKIYWALIVGVPSIEDGLVDLPLAKEPGTGGEKMHVDKENGLAARTRYRVIDRAGNRACWVELQPLTGRTHQLRAHMAAIGHPIVGDGKYGAQDAFLTGGISRKMHLHARRIRIDHPESNILDVIADPPSHFEESLAHLGFDVNAGDLSIEKFDPDTDPDVQARRAAAAAKSRRKERRGERRQRGNSSPTGKPSAGPAKRTRRPKR